MLLHFFLCISKINIQNSYGFAKIEAIMALKPPLYIVSVACPHSCFFLKETGEVMLEGDIAVGNNKVGQYGSYCRSTALVLGTIRCRSVSAFPRLHCLRLHLKTRIRECSSLKQEEAKEEREWVMKLAMS